MLSQRNNMAHIYDGNAAKALAQEIISRFIPAFEKLEKASVSDTPIFWIRSEKLFYKHMEAHDGT